MNRINGATPQVITITIIPPPAGLSSDNVYVRRFWEAVRNVSGEIRFATPEWARSILADHRARNRPINASWRRHLESIDVRRAWQFNGESIVFDRDGRLIDGQHRLQAIAESTTGGVPINVVYGVDSAAFDTFDSGSKRTASHVLGMLNVENNTIVASALGWQMRWETGPELFAEQFARSVPNDTIKLLMDKYPEMIECVGLVNQFKPQKMVPPALASWLCYQFRQIDQAGCEVWFNRILGGIGVEKHTHEWLLLRRLSGDLAGQRLRHHQVEIAALCIKTWNRMRNGETPGQMVQWKRTAGEAFPIIR